MNRSKIINLWIFIMVTLVPKSGTPSEATQSKGETSNAAVDLNVLYEAAAALETEIELSISAEYLLGPKGGPGVLRQSDPMCVTSIQPPDGNHWIEYHRTEVVLNFCDPKFNRKVTFPMYSLDQKQLLKFELYSVKYSEGSHLSDHFFLGQAQCELGKFMELGEMKIILRDKTYKKRTLGSVIIRVEKLTNTYDEVILQLAGKKLAKKSWIIGTTNPFLEIYKRTADDKENVFIYETEVTPYEAVKNSLDLEWKKIVMPVKHLCSGDYNRVLRFVCYDHNRFLNDGYIGEIKTTLGEISGENKKTTFNLKDPDKKNEKIYGEIEFKNVNIITVPPFTHFIKNGLKVRCIFAIDFSDGNDEFHQRPKSHKDPKLNLSKYEKVISSIVSIIEEFGLDPRFQVLGIGGQQPEGHIHDVFNLNEDSADCYGIEGVLNAYHQRVSGIKSAGPAKFASVIQKAMQITKIPENHDNYFILLMLARGSISDLDETRHVIKQAAKFPLSIIIVGIDDSAIESIRTLLHEDDDDEAPKSANKSRKIIELRRFSTREDTEEARRDPIHYVSYNTFSSHQSGLTRELLSHIPGQVVSYMRFYGNHKPTDGAPSTDPSPST